MNKICFLTLKGKRDIGGRGRELVIFSRIVRPETLSAVKEWLKQLPSQGLEAVDCSSYTLDEPQIAAIEKAVLDVQVHTCTHTMEYSITVIHTKICITM